MNKVNKLCNQNFQNLLVIFYNNQNKSNITVALRPYFTWSLLHPQPSSLTYWSCRCKHISSISTSTSLHLPIASSLHALSLDLYMQHLLTSVLSKIMHPILKDVHVLIPRPCEYVTIHGKRGLENLSCIKGLEMESLSEKDMMMEQGKRNVM